MLSSFWFVRYTSNCDLGFAVSFLIHHMCLVIMMDVSVLSFYIIIDFVIFLAVGRIYSLSFIVSFETLSQLVLKLV